MTITEIDAIGPMLEGSKENHDWARIDGIMYKRGDILECIKEGAKHGPIGHRLMISSIRHQGNSSWFWCHGLKNIEHYNYYECERLIKEYPFGNFGVNPDDRRRYKIIIEDWDD